MHARASIEGTSLSKHFLGETLRVMKLCFISPYKGRRIVVHELAKYLVKKKKFEVTILQPSSDPKLTRKTSPELIDGNVERIYFRSRFLRNIAYTLPYFHKEFKTLYTLVSKLKCEIIQSCNYSYLTSVVPIFIGKRYSIPLILTEQALPGYSWFYGGAFIDAVAKLYTYGLGKWIISSYDRVVLITKRVSEEITKFGVPRKKILWIPNGVDLEGFSSDVDSSKLQDELSIKQDDKVLLFVGRLAKVKRVEILIALTKLLQKESFRVKTVVVGDGPSREYYEKLARSIKADVIFTGWVPRQQLHNYYRMASVFVLPSLSEGLPTVLLEASAAGKPCVASNVGGVPDIIVHGKTGYLAKRLDIYSYLHYVKILLTDEELSKRMGKNAAEHVDKNFKWDTIVDKYEKLYREVLVKRT